MFFDYVEAWPDEIKQVQREYQRLYYKKINLANNMETADYSTFDALYTEFERTDDALRSAAKKFDDLRRKYEAKHGVLSQN